MGNPHQLHHQALGLQSMPMQGPAHGKGCTVRAASYQHLLNLAAITMSIIRSHCCQQGIAVQHEQDAMAQRHRQLKMAAWLHSSKDKVWQWGCYRLLVITLLTLSVGALCAPALSSLISAWMWPMRAAVCRGVLPSYSQAG